MEGSFRARLDEIDEKYRKPDKKRKKKRKKLKAERKAGGLNGILQGFNEKQTKGNAQNSLLKTVADLAGVGVGTAVSAAAGRIAPLLGIAMIGTGHYIGDDSGLLRVAGAAAVAHSVAKSKEYRQGDSTIMDRLKGLKDDWLRLALMKREEENNPAAATSVTQAAVSQDSETFVPESKVEPVQQPAPQRRQTPYEKEIEQRQREIDQEAKHLRTEMQQCESEQAGTKQQEIDLSGLNKLEYSLYGAAQQHLQNGEFNGFDHFDDDENENNFADSADDETSDEPTSRSNTEGKSGKTLWPPKPEGNYEDYLDEDDYNFNDY